MKNNTLWLSFYTMDQLHNSAHQWMNKIAGVPFVETIYMKEGKEGHRLIQDHISGKKPREDIKSVLMGVNFPIVEEVQFDKRLNWRTTLQKNGFDIVVQGFCDGLDVEVSKKPTKMAEIKLSGSVWTGGKFQKSMQRKLYKWGIPSLEVGTIISANRQPESWESTMRVGDCPMTNADALEADEWVAESIDRVFRVSQICKGREEGSGLDANGKCSDAFCGYGDSCLYK